MHEIKKTKKKEETIQQKLKTVKTKIKKNIEKTIIDAKPKMVFDKEALEIEKFIKTSVDLGMNKGTILKDLKEMGFKKEKIEFVFRRLHS